MCVLSLDAGGTLIQMTDYCEKMEEMISNYFLEKKKEDVNSLSREEKKRERSHEYQLIDCMNIHTHMVAQILLDGNAATNQTINGVQKKHHQ